MVMRSSLVAFFFFSFFPGVFCLVETFSFLEEKISTPSKGWFRSIDLWVMGPARFRCATLLTLEGSPKEYFSTLILSHFPNISKFNIITFSVFFSLFSFFIYLLYAFCFLSGPYSPCHSQNINATRSLVCSPPSQIFNPFFRQEDDSHSFWIRNYDS